jgi:MOSC domain-containing protein YiiM
MQLISINIGQARPIKNAKASGQTGIYKNPVSKPVLVTYTGLRHDVICDTENHGGVDQAVYVYGTPDYAWWSETLGYDLLPGTFGENLTFTDLVSAEVSIGDRFLIGTVTLEVTAPRIPCVTLASRMGDPGFLKRFREAERPGLYCRVIKEGYIHPTQAVTFSPYQGETIKAIDLFRDFFEPDHSEATLRRHLAAPIALRAQLDKEKQLQKVLTTSKLF